MSPVLLEPGTTRPWRSAAVLFSAFLAIAGLAGSAPARAAAKPGSTAPPAPGAVPGAAQPSPRTPAPGAAPAQVRGAAVPSTPLVVVVPFENTSENRSLYWVGEALADGLNREIRQAGGLPADRRDRAALREEMGVPALSTLTLASQIRIAEKLGASVLVTGTFGVDGDTLNVLARTVTVGTGRTAPWARIAGSIKDLIQLQKEVYHAVAGSLPPLQGPRPLPEDAPAAEDGVPQAAYESLLKSFLEDSPDKRERLLRRALDLAPQYLRAKIELAQLYRDSDQVDKAIATLSNLATRDRSLASEGENLLAELELERGHAEAAEAALRRSLALSETARAHLLLARLAAARGDRPAALAELERSRLLDPTDPDLAEVEESLAIPR